MAQDNKWYSASKNTDTNKSKVGFFGLKNDGDSALVRIMHDDLQSFDVQTVHSLKVGDRFRKISCLRTDEKDSLDNCPLCAAGEKVTKRVFVRMVQYTKDESGNIEANPVIWDRPMGFAYDLKSKLTTYGPLSEHLFIITRHGVAGDMKTTYSVDYAVPTMYSQDVYKKPTTDLFEGFNTLGVMVMNKSYDEIAQFVATGSFPVIEKSETEGETSAYGTAPYVSPQPTNSYSTQSTQNPWETKSSTVQRPVRSY